LKGRGREKGWFNESLRLVQNPDIRKNGQQGKPAGN